MSLMKRMRERQAAEPKPVEMQPRKPRSKPAAAEGPEVIPNEDPLIYYRISEKRLQQVLTKDHAKAIADMSGHPWLIATASGKQIAMSRSFRAALAAKEVEL